MALIGHVSTTNVGVNNSCFFILLCAAEIYCMQYDIIAPPCRGRHEGCGPHSEQIISWNYAQVLFVWRHPAFCQSDCHQDHHHPSHHACVHRQPRQQQSRVQAQGVCLSSHNMLTVLHDRYRCWGLSGCQVCFRPRDQVPHSHPACCTWAWLEAESACSYP